MENESDIKKRKAEQTEAKFKLAWTEESRENEHEKYPKRQEVTAMPKRRG